MKSTSHVHNVVQVRRQILIVATRENKQCLMQVQVIKKVILKLQWNNTHVGNSTLMDTKVWHGRGMFDSSNKMKYVV